MGPAPPVKACTRCRVARALEDFQRDRSKKDGRYSRCKECTSATRGQARAANFEKRRTFDLKHKYGIVREFYESLLKAQDWRCGSCGQPETAVDWRTGKVKALSVDHDHRCCPGDRACGKCVRGLLCYRCNSILGLALDDPDRLAKAIAYLKRAS